MKSQGLPINFIVVAALAILVLVLAAGFLIAGSGSIGGAVGPTTARNTCNGYCANLKAKASNEAPPDGETETMATWSKDTKFCTTNQTVQGYADEVSCTDLVGQCIVSFSDGSQRAVECSLAGQ